MKFNRKVFVVPEEKYHSMVRDLKLRAEVVGGAHQLPPTQPPKSVEGPLQISREGVDEVVGGPETNPPEGGEASTLLKSDLKKNTSRGKKPEEEGLSSDVSPYGATSKENVRKIRTLLAPYKGGKGGSKNFTASLLHTQSSRHPLPTDYKAFYSVLLEKSVPLNLIGNKRLRRVLHYLKNRGGGKSQRSSVQTHRREGGRGGGSGGGGGIVRDKRGKARVKRGEFISKSQRSVGRNKSLKVRRKKGAKPAVENKPWVKL